MLITDLEKYEDIHATVIQNLRNLGVKHRTKKTNKKVQVSNYLYKRIRNNSLKNTIQRTTKQNVGYIIV